MTKFKVLFITLIVLVTVFSAANANFSYGEFTTGIDGWFADWNNNLPTLIAPTQSAYVGSDGCLRFFIVSTSLSADTNWYSGDYTCSPFGFENMDFTGETTISCRIAFTGSIATARWQARSKSGAGWSEGTEPDVYQVVDGNFYTYSWAIDTNFVYSATSCTYPFIVSMEPDGPGCTNGAITAYVDWVRSYGSVIQPGPDVYSDWINKFDPSGAWIGNWDQAAILGHSGAQNSTGLIVNYAGVGTMSWIDLSTTVSTHNYGAAVSGQWNNAQPTMLPYTFIEYRFSASTATTGVNSGVKVLNGVQLFANGGMGSFQAINQGIPVDGQYHTYSFSYAVATVAAAANTTARYNQLGINVSGHGGTDVQFVVDYVKFKTSGAPYINSLGTVIPNFNDPANTIYVLNGATKQFEAVWGTAPLTWSLTSVSGAVVGSLSTTGGSTTVFTAGGSGAGSGYITVTDAVGRSWRTPTIQITATDAPLVTDSEVTDVHHAQFDLYKE